MITQNKRQKKHLWNYVNGLNGDLVVGIGVGLVPVCWYLWNGLGIFSSRNIWQRPTQGGWSIKSLEFKGQPLE